jgi:hypothetical protein
VTWSPRSLRWSAAATVLAALVLTGCADADADADADSGISPEGDRFSVVNPGDDLWQGDAAGCRSGTVDVTDPAVASALAVAMPEAEFWELIEVMDGGEAEGDFRRLSEALAKRPIDDLVAFDARLALSLYALDDECRLLRYRDDDPHGMGFVSEDVFLYARADVVSMGKDAWDSAIADGRLPVRMSEGIGELLLYVALDASVAQGMEEYAIWDLERERYSLSYESGSNPAGWPES